MSENFFSPLMQFKTFGGSFPFYLKLKKKKKRKRNFFLCVCLCVSLELHRAARQDPGQSGATGRVRWRLWVVAWAGQTGCIWCAPAGPYIYWPDSLEPLFFLFLLIPFSFFIFFIFLFLCVRFFWWGVRESQFFSQMMKTNTHFPACALNGNSLFFCFFS